MRHAGIHELATITRELVRIRSQAIVLIAAIGGGGTATAARVVSGAAPGGRFVACWTLIAVLGGCAVVVAAYLRVRVRALSRRAQTLADRIGE